MKKQQKKFIIITLFILLLFLKPLSFANDSDDLILQPKEYSEDFKKWLKLSDEEKSKVIMPRVYDVEYKKSNNINPLKLIRSIRASIDSIFSLKDIIPENLVIKNQQQTGECWAFAALSSLETNLALKDYKNGISQPKIYDYSERHMDYSTIREFANGALNEYGYNRSIGSSGKIPYAHSYLTNGMGAILESEMPFENNLEIIDISEIQNKTVSSQVYDTVIFPDYSALANEERIDVINQIKEHIQNYGAVFAYMHNDSSLGCYRSDTAALYCNNSTTHTINHAVSIIGWDDDYSSDNFSEGKKPTSNGAWIARNSWGESYGDEGYIYISYEDVNAPKQMLGIIKATDEIDYDYIYQYDELFPMITVTTRSPNVLIGNIFNKQSTGTEYLTQVSVYSPNTYSYKVYVNPNGNGMSRDELQPVALKAGESETLNTGYHTLEFSDAIEINADSFVVVLEIQSDENDIEIALESQLSGTQDFNTVKVEEGKCFYAISNNSNNITWADLNSQYGDSTIKAFTTTELNDGSLKNIEITTPPTKTTYFEGEDFDKTGMVVTAYFHSETNPSAVLDDSSYSITNGTNLQVGQTSVTISYDGKTIEQPITVEENSIVNLEITTPPTKTEYKEGENFDKTGMIVAGIYQDGSTKQILDYTIENGINLSKGQTSVTITYNGMSATQNITVVEKSVIGISISKLPSKTQYVQNEEDLDLTGGMLKVTYNDNSTEEISLTSELITVSGFDNTEVGANTLSVTYMEFTITLDVVIIENHNDPSTDNPGTDDPNTDDPNTDDPNTDDPNTDDPNTDDPNTDDPNTDDPSTDDPNTDNPNTDDPNENPQDGNAESSNFENANCKINKAQLYTFSNNDNQEYLLVDLTINGITINTGNDSYKYYYYLSANQDENNIQDWIEIDEVQTSNNSINFEVNSKDIKNYLELLSSDTLYLYIREVTTKGGSQSVTISKPMKVELNADIEIEIYRDNAKIENMNSNNNTNNNDNNNNQSGNDTTIAQEDFPKTGLRNIIIIGLAVILLGTVIFFIRYKKLNSYVK